MIEWLKSLFTTRQAVLDLTDQVARLRKIQASFDEHILSLEKRIEKLEQLDKLNARVSTAKRETARNWSAFRQMAEQAEGVEDANGQIR